MACDRTASIHLASDESHYRCCVPILNDVFIFVVVSRGVHTVVVAASLSWADSAGYSCCCLNKAHVLNTDPIGCVQMHASFTFTFICLLADLNDAYPDDVVCYRNWYFGNQRPAPRRCPPSDVFTYYECCRNSDACCQRIRVELLILILVPLLVLVAVLCCCTIASIINRRKKSVNDEPQLSRDERDCHYFY